MVKDNLSINSREEATASKIEAAQSILAQEVALIQSGDDWKRFLDFQSQLHSYSANNVMLIASQHQEAFKNGLVSEPNPNFVAGFHTWKALGRQVDKGQRGYSILAPCRYERKIAVDGSGERREIRKGDRLSDGETLERQKVLAGFRVEHVFDLSQTSGKDVPIGPMPSLLEGEAPYGLGSSVIDVIESHGFHVDTVVNSLAIGGANGQTIPEAKMVVIRNDMDEAAMVKTLIHEAAHVLLHTTVPGSRFPRHVMEVEAESVAYVVASAHGMPTDSYSFPYVARWAGEDAPNVVASTQQRVAKAAKEIIEASPAPHGSGGKAPGAEVAIANAQQRRAERELERSQSKDQEVAVGL